MPWIYATNILDCIACVQYHAFIQTLSCAHRTILKIAKLRYQLLVALLINFGMKGILLQGFMLQLQLLLSMLQCSCLHKAGLALEHLLRFAPICSCDVVQRQYITERKQRPNGLLVSLHPQFLSVEQQHAAAWSAIQNSAWHFCIGQHSVYLRAIQAYCAEMEACHSQRINIYSFGAQSTPQRHRDRS